MLFLSFIGEEVLRLGLSQGEHSYEREQQKKNFDYQCDSDCSRDFSGGGDYSKRKRIQK
jgi:hypothetical protein